MATTKKAAKFRPAAKLARAQDQTITAATPAKPAEPAQAGKRTNDASATQAKAGKDKRGKKKDKKSGDVDHERKKLVRDSFTMPTGDYALIGELKVRALASGTPVKKSELLRAGLIALAQMPSPRLIDLIDALPKIKTGRPGKKK